MSRLKWFFVNFFYGFTAALCVLLAVVIAVYYSSVAETNTRAMGFGDKEGSKVFYVNQKDGVLRLFGKEWQAETP